MWKTTEGTRPTGRGLSCLFHRPFQVPLRGCEQVRALFVYSGKWL